MSDVSSPLLIRPWLEGDELELTQLFQRTFGREITAEHWKWKLRPEPHALNNVWLAVSDRKPIFQYAGIPIRFSVAGQAAQAIVSVDTMTAPEFRRRGLLTQVARQAYSSWRGAGAAFVIGLPNENWGSRAGALGWRPLFPLQWLILPLRPEAILARLSGWPALLRGTLLSTVWNTALRMRTRSAPDIQVAPVDHADSSFDRIWDLCKGDWTFSTVRDRHWVQWRFLSAPSRRYEVSVACRSGAPTGYLAHTIDHSPRGVSACIAEVCAQREDLGTRNTLLANLIKTLRATPAQSLYVLAVPGTGEFTWLRRAGFLPRHAFEVQFVPLRDDLPADRMADRQQWNLTGADFDVV